jgi:hypothetical protein
MQQAPLVERPSLAHGATPIRLHRNGVCSPKELLMSDRSEPKQHIPNADPHNNTDADDDSPFSNVLYGLGAFAMAAVAYVKWDSISLPADSAARGRYAGAKRLLGRVGQLPVTLIIVAFGMLFVAIAVHGLRSARRNE